jgi:RNA polymerase sigma-70 factor, ECF subfamily
VPHRASPPLSSDQDLTDFLRSVEKRAFKRTVYAVRDEDAALDIVQDAMIRLAEKYADRPVAEWPMLFQRILSNATMDWFRHQKVRNAVLHNFSDFEGSGDDPDFDLLETLEAQEASIDTESTRTDLADHRRRDRQAPRTSTRSLPHALLGGTGRG